MLLFLEALAKWSQTQPDKVLYTYLDDRGAEVGKLTYAQMNLKSAALAHELLQRGLQKGDRVMLVFEPSLNYILSFIACIRVGLVAVPVFPPDPRKLRKDMYMFVTVCNNCGAQVALTSTSYNSYKKMADLKNIFSNDAKWPDLTWIVVDELPSVNTATEASALDLIPLGSADIAPTDIAFLQYTSGSTSEPKGVMISHSNLAHNLSLIIHELKAGDDTVVVSWLPQYHDMGLIGSYLGSLYCGGCGFMMSPFSFLKSPLLWLQMVSKHRGTHLQAPNFAYALTARKLKQLKRPLNPPLELSCVRHMINAAEPVDAKILGEFYEIFGQFGLPHGCVYPTYGLAEHTVFVCSGGAQVLTVDKEQLERDNRVVVVEEDASGAAAAEGGGDLDRRSTLAGCGFPAAPRPEGVESVECAIVELDSPEGANGSTVHRRLPPDHVGEIWVRSPSKAQGYWGMPEKTAEDFQAVCTPTPEADANDESAEFLRTGDLGFVHNDELFICGRLKDLIILKGRNYYPQDIERCLEDVAPDLLRAGRSAAFAVDWHGEERVVVVAELKKKESRAVCEQLAKRVRSACMQHHGVQLATVILCKDHTVPITTSGKIARRWCKRSYDAGTFETIFRWEEPDTDRSMAAAEDPSVEPGPAAALQDMEPISQADLDKILAMPDDELMEQMVQDAAAAVNFDEETLREQTDVALVTLGLDSLGLAQMKGILENQYGCPVPDQWMYFETTTLQECLLAVRMGGITEEQADGTPLEIQQSPDGGNQLAQTCPCLLMCCPGLVLG